jgi:xanthine phosphoribosyltransferase
MARPDGPLNPVDILSPAESLKFIEGSRLNPAAKLLGSRIIEEGRTFPLKPKTNQDTEHALDLTRFLNHALDTELMTVTSQELARQLAPVCPGVVLTASNSGIAGSYALTRSLSEIIPVKDVRAVYARKEVPATFRDGEVYWGITRSPTLNEQTNLSVAVDCLPEGSRVAIFDDFMRSGETATALVNICTQAGASVVALAFLVEKTFKGGRQKLNTFGIADDQIISLLKVSGIQPGQIRIEDSTWLQLKSYKYTQSRNGQ